MWIAQFPFCFQKLNVCWEAPSRPSAFLNIAKTFHMVESNVNCTEIQSVAFTGVDYTSSWIRGTECRKKVKLHPTFQHLALKNGQIINLCEREVEPSNEESNSSPNMHTYICPYAKASNGSPTNDTDYQETQTWGKLEGCMDPSSDKLEGCMDPSICRTTVEW